MRAPGVGFCCGSQLAGRAGKVGGPCSCFGRPRAGIVAELEAGQDFCKLFLVNGFFLFLELAGPPELLQQPKSVLSVTPVLLGHVSRSLANFSLRAGHRGEGVCVAAGLELFQPPALVDSFFKLFLCCLDHASTTTGLSCSLLCDTACGPVSRDWPQAANELTPAWIICIPFFLNDSLACT